MPSVCWFLNICWNYTNSSFFLRVIILLQCSSSRLCHRTLFKVLKTICRHDISKRTPLVPFIVNLSIATCLSGFSKQFAKWGQLRKLLYVSWRLCIWRGSQIDTFYTISIISLASHCNAPVGFQALPPLSLFLALSPFCISLLTDIHVSICIFSTARRIFFFISCFFLDSFRNFAKNSARLRFIFIRSIICRDTITIYVDLSNVVNCDLIVTYF